MFFPAPEDVFVFLPVGALLRAPTCGDALEAPAFSHRVDGSRLFTGLLSEPGEKSIYFRGLMAIDPRKQKSRPLNRLAMRLEASRKG